MKSKYSADEKVQIIMESLANYVSPFEICPMHGIYGLKASKWREQYI
jgi:transposase-like protein